MWQIGRQHAKSLHARERAEAPRRRLRTIAAHCLRGGREGSGEAARGAKRPRQACERRLRVQRKSTTEYLGLLGDPQPVAVGAITLCDALLVIDMQRDFAPKSATNPDGGRFGVAEGEHIVPCIEQLIHHVRAQRHTHSKIAHLSHFSFFRFARSSTTRRLCRRDARLPSGRPHFAHASGSLPCALRTRLTRLLLSKADRSALATAKTAGGNIDIAFKGLHEDIDSFGALPYYEGGDGRIQKDAKLVKETCLACCMGCSQAPWTGSLLMKQSSIIEGMKAGSEGKLDMDAPPDAFACLDDGRPRGLETLPDKLKDCDRIFVCGLALDFCVLDTCLNAVKGKEGAGYNAKQEVHMVLDAARAAYIPGVGTFGSSSLGPRRGPGEDGHRV